MPRVEPHPDDLFAPGRRHLILLAHYDDEVPYGGLIQRMGPEVCLVWLTNGDGLAEEAEMGLSEYADMRLKESLAAMAHLQVDPARLHALEHSEVEIYDLMAQMVRGETGGKAPERFLSMADEVEVLARDFNPDVVWALAYQGGHPEHDLIHLYGARLVKRLAQDRQAPVPFYELPEYELIVVPFRFKPWRQAPYHEIRLTESEFVTKSAMLDCFPSQKRIISEFRKIVGFYGRLSWLRGKPFGFDDFASREVFAPVPSERDYGRSSHVSPRLDYIGDDYQGTPIDFSRTLAPISRALGL
jgi:LmbE family N-acetylglucosaminyl deacetylase